MLPHEKEQQDFLESLSAQNRSTATISTYQFILNDFHKHLQKSITLTNRQEIFSYLNKKDAEIKINKRFANKRDRLSSNSKNLYIACLKKYAEFNKNFELTREISTIRVKTPYKQAIKITATEINQLATQNIASNPQLNTRNSLICKLLYDTGMRRSEVASLTTEALKNFNPAKPNLLVIIKGKGGKERKILIPREWIFEYLSFASSYGIDVKNPKTPLFTSNKSGERLNAMTITNIVRTMAEQGKIIYNRQAISPHKLRSTYATNLNDAGENVLKIQQLLGHSNLDTTKRYVNISNDELEKTKIKTA